MRVCLMDEKEMLFMDLTVDIMRDLGYDLDSNIPISAEFVKKFYPVVEKAFQAGVKSTMKMMEIQQQRNYLNAIPVDLLPQA